MDSSIWTHQSWILWLFPIFWLLKQKLFYILYRLFFIFLFYFYKNIDLYCEYSWNVKMMAESKGLEPSASCVTGRRYNQLNYDSTLRNIWYLMQLVNTFFYFFSYKIVDIFYINKYCYRYHIQRVLFTMQESSFLIFLYLCIERNVCIPSLFFMCNM